MGRHITTRLGPEVPPMSYSPIATEVNGTPLDCPGILYSGACWITTPGNNSCASACTNMYKSYDNVTFAAVMGTASSSAECENGLLATGLYSGVFIVGVSGSSSGTVVGTGLWLGWYAILFLSTVVPVSERW